MPVDPALTYPCGEPDVVVETWRDLAVYAVTAKALLEKCNQRMTEIRGLGGDRDAH